MKWSVVKSIPADLMRGTPRRIREEQAAPVTVEADALSIEAGTLVFVSGGAVKQAYGPGAWASVEQLPEPVDPPASGETVAGTVESGTSQEGGEVQLGGGG